VFAVVWRATRPHLQGAGLLIGEDHAPVSDGSCDGHARQRALRQNDYDPECRNDLVVVLPEVEVANHLAGCEHVGCVVVPVQPVRVTHGIRAILDVPELVDALREAEPAVRVRDRSRHEPVRASGWVLVQRVGKAIASASDRCSARGRNIEARAVQDDLEPEVRCGAGTRVRPVQALCRT